MKLLPPFRILIVSVLLVAAFAWLADRLIRQRREMQVLRDRIAEITTHSRSVVASRPAPPPERPSAELLRARAEVSGLTQQVAGRAEGRSPAGAAADGSGNPGSELDRLMKGRRPSEFPDFAAAETMEYRGFDTPDHALESFFWHYAGPDRGGASSITNLWWSPPANAPAGFHYEIDLGMGFGGLTGYRVVHREEISADEILFHLQREEGRSVVEEQARFIRDGNRWVRKPSVNLVRDKP